MRSGSQLRSYVEEDGDVEGERNWLRKLAAAVWPRRREAVC